MPEGDITVGKLWEILPFDDTLCTLSMTGTQITQVLQYGIKNQQYGMVQFSGLRVQYNGSLEPDKRILKVTLTDGTPLQADKTYRVVINDYMAEGGDGFTMFGQCPDLTNTKAPIRDMLINHIEKVQSINFEADDRLQELSTME
jgi:2',3'-cyclic-nucleotide 2'-phosphodiesterase/3'-nucleotidase